MDKDVLKQLGLSDNESEVYLLLLQMREALASDIAKKSKISRPHIYDTIAKLIDKGLASYVLQNGRRVYRPADPEVLVDLLKAKAETLGNAMPELRKLYAPAKEKPVVEVYEGKESLKALLNELLRDGKGFKAFGPTTRWKYEVPIAIKRYFKEREKIGFKGQLLYPEGTEVYRHPLNEFRPIPKEYSSPATTVMYGKKTAFILWLDPILTITIDNKEFSDSFRNYFDMVWNQHTRTYQGIEGLKTVMNQIIEDKPKELLAYGSSGASFSLFPKFIDKWHKDRVKNKINLKIIFTDTKQSRERIKHIEKNSFFHQKFMGSGYYSPVGTIIYDNKVILIAITKDGFATVIENKEIAKAYKKQFDVFWKFAKSS